MKIQKTTNYMMFQSQSLDNRLPTPKKHKRLYESMKAYGFMECFPMVVVRSQNGSLVVKDGQNRLMFAMELGLPVFWVEAKDDFDVAVVNSAAQVWVLSDYSRKHEANGLKSYREGNEFAAAHRLPLGRAFALLSGTATFGNVYSQFVSGTWKVKDRTWANAVVGIYGPLTTMAPEIRNDRFLAACMAVCRVQEFEPQRLIESAKRWRDKLLPYSTKDAYLDMLEEIYNFHKSKLVGLKTAAIMAMRERNPKKEKQAS
jgi:hypothetical protein